MINLIQLIKVLVFFIFISIDGPGGRVCGQKSGYASLTRVKPGNQQDLRLSVVVQGPSYKWLVKISQIPCNMVSYYSIEKQ